MKMEVIRFNSLAQSTQKNLLTHYRFYLLFCVYFGLQHIPVDEENLLVYITFLSKSLSSPSSVKNYVYGIQTLSKLKGWKFPRFQFQFKGIARVLLHTVQRAHPLSPPIFLRLLHFIDLSNSYEATMWAIMIVGFLMFARIGNLLPSTRVFDREKQLTRGDVLVAADAVVVTVKWTKTIQTRQRVLTLPLYANSDSPLCPKKCLLRVARLAPASKFHHLFSYKSKSGLSVILQSEFIRFLRSKLSKAGFDPEKFSGHSLRRGGATWAFGSGVSSELIRNHGDWASDAYLSYLDFSLKERLETTRLMMSL